MIKRWVQDTINAILAADPWVLFVVPAVLLPTLLLLAVLVTR